MGLDCMNPRPVLLMAVSHKDVNQAELWLRWASFLCQRDGWSNRGESMLLMFTRRAAPEKERLWRAMKGIESREAFRFFVDECHDEFEIGYPASASHLFLRSLETCERRFPGRPILWVEPDSAPLRPSWFSEIAAEYETCGHAFYGERIHHAGRKTSHCTGHAVYPHDWRKRAPKLTTVLEAPDHPMFGGQPGFPWDVWACEETTADLHETKLIHQIFNITPFTMENLNRIRPEAALFHRCKNGTLIAALAQLPQYRGFAETLPEPTETFMLMGHPSRLKILGYPEMPWKAMRRSSQWVSLCKPEDRLHAAILRCLVGSSGVSRLDE